MKKRLFGFLFSFLSLGLFAQQDLFNVELYYGNSALFRLGPESPYDFTNREIGLVLGWERLWEKPTTFWWSYGTEIGFVRSDYRWWQKENFDNPMRIEAKVLGRLNFSFGKTSVFASGLFGFTLLQGYEERLAAGFSFTEEANIGTRTPLSESVFMTVAIGVKHVSNLSFYPLNRGLDIASARAGISYAF